MNKNIKVFLISIVIVIVLFMSILTYYKFYKIDSSQEKYYFLGEKSSINYTNNFDNKYSDNILEEVTSIDYFVYDENDAIYGKIFIGDENKLYLKNEKYNSYKLLIENKKFKTLKNRVNDEQNGLFVYALTLDGDMYLISLIDTDIGKVVIKEYEFDEKIDKFTTLKFKSYLDLEMDENIVMTVDGKIFDTFSGIEYNKNVINALNKFIILEDDTICISSGKFIFKKDGTKAKVKTIITPVYGEKIFKHNPNVVIITTDNRIIYLKNDDTIYDYGKEILKIEFLDNDITIYFTDNTKINFKGTYDSEIYPIQVQDVDKKS